MDIFIDIRARFAQFADSLDKIKRDTDRTVKSIDTSFKGLNNAIKLVGAGFVVREIGGFVKGVIDAADELQTIHERTGIAVEDLAGLKYAAEQSGAGFEDLTGGLKKLQKSISEAGTGNKELRQLFTDLGMKEAASGALDAQEALLQLADVFPRLSQADQTRVAMELMGRSADALLPAFRNGRKGLEEFIARGKELSPNIAEVARLSDELKDKLNDLGTATQGALLPALNSILPRLTDVVDEFREGIKIAGGFREAIRLFNGQGISPFTTTGEDVRAKRKELEQAQAALAEGPGFFDRLLGNDPKANVEDLEKQLEFLKLRERQAALRDTGAAYRDEGARFSGQSGQPQIKLTPREAKERTPKQAAAGLDDYERALKSLRAELGHIDTEGSKAAETLREIPEIEREMGRKLTGAERSQLLGVAARIDALKEERQIREEIDASIKRQAEHEHAASVAAAESIGEMAFRASLAGGDEDAKRVAQEQRRLAQAVGETSGAYTQFAGAIENAVLAEAGSQVFEATRTDAERLEVELTRLQTLFAKGFINEDTFKRAAHQAKAGLDEMSEFFRQAVRNIQDALAEGLFDVMQGKFDDLGANFKRVIDQMAANAIAAQLGKKLFGDFDATGEIGGWIGDAIGAFSSGSGPGGGSSGVSSMIGDAGGWFKELFSGFSLSGFGFANGGIMTSAGPLPLNYYAGGGVARTPQLAVFGEGAHAEAFVPLPDGRSIPVTMQGGSGGVNVNMTVVTPDANSFNASRDQIAGQMHLAARRVAARNL